MKIDAEKINRGKLVIFKKIKVNPNMPFIATDIKRDIAVKE